ncbi:MAG TPA: GAF domain-containing protein, partial [Blastocatellia bacterium]|nr:GAF domain-containing protein [Blastocatellia bacterium]
MAGTMIGEMVEGGLLHLGPGGAPELTRQAQVLEVVAAGAPLKQALDAIVSLFEQHSLGAFCSILLLDEAGERLRHGAAPNLPEEYMRQIDGVAIGPSVGSCGTAAYIKQRVIVADIAGNPLWADYRELALGYGLRACWSVPIFSPAKQVLGTFAVYYGETRTPEPGELRLIESLAHLASLAIERARAEQKLQASEARFRALTERGGEGISLLGLDGTISYTSPVMTAILGYEVDEVIGKPAQDRVHPDD